jgi:membrane-associated phospholipid phosphatase
VNLWESIFIVGTVLVAVVALAPAFAPGLAGRARRPDSEGVAASLFGRLRAARDHLSADLGRVGAAVVVYAAALALASGACWVLGRLAGDAEKLIDVPMFHSARAGQTHWLTQLNSVLTLMGNRPEIKPVAVVAAVLLAVWYGRRWWVPVAAIASSFVVEFYVQHMLALVVHRGHPPTTLGTWPSGGCARLVSMYGLIIWLYLHNRRHGGRRSAAALWGILVIAAWLEGFSRTILLKHWFTDVAGGWIFGALLLAASIAAFATIDPGRPRSTPADAPELVSAAPPPR